MFGFSKSFVVVLIISIIISVGSRDPIIGLEIMGGYIVLRIIWNVFTKKKKWQKI